MGFRPELTVPQEVDHRERYLRVKVEEDERVDLGHTATEGGVTGSPAEETRGECLGLEEHLTAEVSGKDGNGEENPSIRDPASQGLNLEQEEKDPRLRDSAEGEDQGKVLLREETAQDTPQMHRTEPHRQVVQEEHLHECQDDAPRRRGDGWRNRHEEEVHQDQSRQQISWVHLLVEHRQTLKQILHH